MKKFFVVALIAVALALASVATACKDDGNDQQVETEKAQHSPNTPMFAGKTATITTNDTFTDTQWNAIVTAIVGKFSAWYAGITDGSIKQGAAEEMLDIGLTIIVEKNPTGYTNYKFTKSDRTVYVRADGVDNLDANAIYAATIDDQDTIDGVTPCDCTVKVHPFETPCSCGLAQCDCVTEIQKKFPIEGHNVTIVDGRTNNTAGTPLDASIITGFKTLCDAMVGSTNYDALVASGRLITITLRDDVSFDRYDPAPTSGNNLDVNYTFATTNINTEGNRIRFDTALQAMLNLPYDD